MPRKTILSNQSKITANINEQIEYIRYHNLVNTEELSKKALSKESKKLFLMKTVIEKKKKLLFLLAHSGSIESYKLLQKYQKNADKKLIAWTELCLQECGAFLGADLLDQNETATKVINGAGGDGTRFRVFFILSTEKSRSFIDKQKNKIKKCIQAVDKKLESHTEKINFGKDFILLSVLISIEIAPEQYFQEIYKSVNIDKDILRYHYYCTNIKKPSLKEIKEYLRDLK